MLIKRLLPLLHRILHVPLKNIPRIKQEDTPDRCCSKVRNYLHLNNSFELLSKIESILNDEKLKIEVAEMLMRKWIILYFVRKKLSYKYTSHLI